MGFLGEFPIMADAKIHMLDVSQEKVMVDTGLFPVLEYFEFQFDEDVTSCLSFKAGVMPKVRMLAMEFGCAEWRGAATAGMECLPCLPDIRVCLINSSTESSKKIQLVLADVESSFRSAALPARSDGHCCSGNIKQGP